jgi:hypothetical protein
MQQFRKAALAAVLMAGAAFFAAAPARADVSVGFSFGYDGGYFSDPCAYYDYYDQPPPWGLPPDYCNYPVYFEPVFIGGSWYRGPIYYRWYGGERLFWLNGGWRRDEWRGARPSIRWVDRGNGGYHGRGAPRGGNTGSHWSGNNGWSDRGWNNNNRSGWNGGRDNNRGWNNNAGNNNHGSWNNNGGNRGWSGGGGGRSSGWPGGGNNGGNRGWSGGGHSGSGGPGGGGHNGGSHGGGGQGGNGSHHH